MAEIYQNGPIAVNFYAMPDLYNYKSGIYTPSTTEKAMEMELE